MVLYGIGLLIAAVYLGNAADRLEGQAGLEANETIRQELLSAATRRRKRSVFMRWLGIILLVAYGVLVLVMTW